jgi:hypothetical protein
MARLVENAVVRGRGRLGLHNATLPGPEATFSKAGQYEFYVTVTDAKGLTCSNESGGFRGFVVRLGASPPHLRPTSSRCRSPRANQKLPKLPTVRGNISGSKWGMTKAL